MQNPTRLRMIRFFLCLVFSCFFCSLRSQKNISIHIPENRKEIKELGVELQDYLSRAARDKFLLEETKAGTGGGIFLSIETLNPQYLKKEGYEITGTGNSVTIRANHISGLRNGVYNYLYRLGFRFYLPGDIWTHIPRLSSVFYLVKQQQYPLFQNRSMFGTGGFPYHPVLDRGYEVQKSWEKWLKRNRWSAEEYIGGHEGEIFNQKYEPLLKADTFLLAKFMNKRVWSLSSKWCVSNPKLVELFVKDRVEAFELQKKKVPDRNYISVEPADGGGYCECENCTRIGNASDQVFFLANETARALKKKWPTAGVSLYAYNDHAAPPRQKLEDNVYVGVIPYAFQQVAAPEILLTEWRKKCSLTGVYDYWNLTDGSKDLPQLNYLLYLPQKIKLWTRLGIKGYSLESGYSKFGSGLFLYFLSRISWDKNASVDELLQEFCSANFGPAAGVLKSMLRRWSVNFEPHRETGLAFSDIAKARTLTQKPEILRRLRELEDYVYYMAYFTDAMDHINTSEESQKIENCIRYIWTIHDECILNTSRIHQYFLLRPVRERQITLVDKWSLTNTAIQKEQWEAVREQKLTSWEHQALLSPLFFKKSPAVKKEASNSGMLDSRLKKLKLVFDGKDSLIFNCGKTLYYSFNSGNANSFSFAMKLPQKANESSMPGVAIYDEKRNFINYVLCRNQPGILQLIKFDGLKKNTRYYILVNVPSIRWETHIPNKAILIDGANINNVYTSLQTSQKVFLLTDPDQDMIQLNTSGFKGVVYTPQNKPLLDMQADPSASSVKTKGMSYLRVEQRGSSTLSLKTSEGESLYFFKNSISATK